MTTKHNLTDEFLFNYFGMPKEGSREYDSFHFAIQPYTCLEEYLRDKNLMHTYNSANNPQDKFLLIMATKVERTDKAILGLER